MKDVIIFDVDGTAIDSPRSQTPSERLVRAVGAAKNAYSLCAATGRVWSFAKPVLQKLELDDPCIVSAGTQICDPRTEAVLWQNNIEQACMNEIIAAVRELPRYKVLFNDYDQETYFHGAGMSVELTLEQPTYFFGLIFVPDDEAKRVVDAFSHIGDIACTRALAQRHGYSDILITNQNATKEHAVARLLELLGVDESKARGIGDGTMTFICFELFAARWQWETRSQS